MRFVLAQVIENKKLSHFLQRRREKADRQELSHCGKGICACLRMTISSEEKKHEQKRKKNNRHH